MPANIYHLPERTSEALYEASFALPEPTAFVDENLAGETVNLYRETLQSVPGIMPLVARMQEDLATVRDARGYLVISDVPTGPAHHSMTIPTALCSLAGQPFVMAEKNGFWQDLGVKLDAVPYRFQGTGENPMHIDAVNTTNPPDYFTFYSLRTDPQGGGVSLLSNVQNMVDKLAPSEIAALQEPRFSEGRFFGMRGVGKEYNPFPILEQQQDGLWLARYTGKMLPEMPDGPDKRLLQRVGELLCQEQESFVLQPASLLITNQHIMAHGRTPLGEGQESVPEDRRRYLRQSYIRSDGTI